METVFHSHHAVISDRMRARAETSLNKLAERFPRAKDAVVRFEQDGPARRVEIVVHALRAKRFVAEGHGRTFGPALTTALRALERQLGREKRDAKDRAHAIARVKVARR